MLKEEIGDAMDISAISCNRYSPGETVEGTFYDFSIYLALFDQDEIGSTFSENYIEGTRICVFSRDTMTISNSPNEWVQFDLDIPFWFNGTDNLIVEFLWSSAETDDSCMYTWHWNTGTIRSINGEYESPTGTMSSLVIMFLFEGDLQLNSSTFGSIKALLGSSGG
ncbi:MAG: hypothetical protein KAQ97_03045 [Candidatus Fermentibacteraceae bacterium]|nr:hypothetical protein [Candidatus Fermentibacteraceae bacterium]